MFMKSFYCSLLVTLLPLAISCGGPRTSTLASNQTQGLNVCPAQDPKINYYTELNSDTGLAVKQFVVSVRDANCQERKVLYEDCLDKDIKGLFGFVTTDPTPLEIKDIDAFKAGDYLRLPSFSCRKDFKAGASRPDAKPIMRSVSGIKGFGLAQIEPKEAGQPTYAVIPNFCYPLKKKLNLSVLAGQYNVDPIDLLKPIPDLGANPQILQFSCAHQEAPKVRSEGWSLARFPINDDAKAYVLRFNDPDPIKKLTFVILWMDGNEAGNYEKQMPVFEAQMIDRLGIKLSEISEEAEPSLDDNTFFVNYNTGDDKSRYSLRMEDKDFASVLLDKSPSLQALSNPYLEVGGYKQLTGSRTLRFRSCNSSQVDDFRSRLGFSAVPGTIKSWEDELKDGANVSTSQREIEVPCFRKKPQCLAELPDGTELSRLGNIDGLINFVFLKDWDRRSCRDSSELEIHLKGSALVQGQAFVVGNTEITRFTKISLTGSPDSRITLDTDCTKFSCEGVQRAAIQVAPQQEIVELRSLQFFPSEKALAADTIAILGKGNPGDRGALWLKGLSLGAVEKTKVNTNPPKQYVPFNTGLWLQNVNTYGTKLNISAGYQALHAEGGSLSLIGERDERQHAKDAVSLRIETLDPQVGAANLSTINLTDVRTFLYATKLRGPRLLDLKANTDQPRQVSVWFADMANSDSAYKSSVAIASLGSIRAAFNFSYFHDLYQVADFGGSNYPINPAIDFNLTLLDSWVSNRDAIKVRIKNLPPTINGTPALNGKKFCAPSNPNICELTF